jgi:hypothetical protein
VFRLRGREADRGVVRSNFEAEQLTATRERLATLQQTADAERAALTQLSTRRAQTEAEIGEAERALEGLRAELAALAEELDAASAGVDKARKAAGRAAKALDGAEKEIALMVSGWRYRRRRGGLTMLCLLGLERGDREVGAGEVRGVQEVPDGQHPAPAQRGDAARRPDGGGAPASVTIYAQSLLTLGIEPEGRDGDGRRRGGRGGRAAAEGGRRLWDRGRLFVAGRGRARGESLPQPCWGWLC